jgi:hypothetical protein
MSRSGQLDLAKGFIMHKMYHYGYCGGRHTSPDNLPKSCPPELSHYVQEAIDKLKQERLLRFKPTSYGVQVSAVRSPVGDAYADKYRIYAGLNPQDFRQLPQQKADALPLDELKKLKFKKRKP